MQLQTARWFREVYQGSPGWNERVRSDPLYAPLLTPKHILKRYPPSVFILARYDLLTHENMQFIEKLQAHQREVSVKVYPTTIHWFFGKSVISKYADDAVLHSVKELKRLLHMK